MHSEEKLKSKECLHIVSYCKKLLKHYVGAEGGHCQIKNNKELP